MWLFFSITHYSLTLADTKGVCVCVFPLGLLPGVSVTLLIRQAEEKLSVFLLNQLQPLLRSWKQVPKMRAKAFNKLSDRARSGLSQS